MSLTDDQKNELAALVGDGDAFKRVQDLVGEWISDEAEFSFERGREDGRDDGVQEGYEQAQEDAKEDSRRRQILPRFEARHSGIAWTVRDMEKGENLPGFYAHYQATDLVADLNRRLRDG